MNAMLRLDPVCTGCNRPVVLAAYIAVRLPDSGQGSPRCICTNCHQCVWCGSADGAIHLFPNEVSAHYNCVLRSQKWGKPVVSKEMLEEFLS